MDSLVMSVDEFARTFGLGLATTYRLLDAGDIPEIRLGARRLIPRAAADQLIATAMAGFDPDKTLAALKLAS